MLIDCTECGHKISDRALACPKCGTPVGLQRESVRNIEAPAMQKPATEMSPPVNPPKVGPSSATPQRVMSNRNKARFPVAAAVLCLALGAAGAFAYMGFTGSGGQTPKGAESGNGASEPNAPVSQQVVTRLEPSPSPHSDAVNHDSQSPNSDSAIAVEEGQPSSTGGFLSEEKHPQSFSPSFSCTAATSEAEHAICGNEDLAQLDRRIAEAYAQALAVSGEARSSVVSSQRQWIRTRDSQCRGDVDCLNKMMVNRVSQLKN